MMPGRNRAWVGASAVVIVMTLASSNSPAQAGGLVGTVARDTLDHRVASAEVTIPALAKRTLTNYLGEFRIDDIAAGRVAVTVRFIGFLPVTDTVTIVADKMVMHEFILTPTPPQLDSVRVVAAAVPKYISPGLRGFEERRTQGFGHFLTETDLRNATAGTMANLISLRVPGVRVVNVRSETFLASGRSSGDGGPVLLDAKARARAGIQVDSLANMQACWLTVYQDGMRVYDATMTMRNPKIRPPDFRLMPIDQFAAVEYYAGGATLPPQFNTTGSECGTLLLWTRER